MGNCLYVEGTASFQDDSLESTNLRMGEVVASAVESEIVSEHNSEEGRSNYNVIIYCIYSLTLGLRIWYFHFDTPFINYSLPGSDISIIFK